AAPPLAEEPPAVGDLFDDPAPHDVADESAPEDDVTTAVDAGPELAPYEAEPRPEPTDFLDGEPAGVAPPEAGIDTGWKPEPETGIPSYRDQFEPDEAAGLEVPEPSPVARAPAAVPASTGRGPEAQ